MPDQGARSLSRTGCARVRYLGPGLTHPIIPSGPLPETSASQPDCVNSQPGAYSRAVLTFGRLGRRSAILLLVIGFLFVILTFLAAFTIYGEVAGLVGLAFIVGGAILLVRSSAPSL
jgi:hypothetical protein